MFPDVLVQSPIHSIKFHPGAGVAVSSTDEPSTNTPPHVSPQLIPGTLLVIVPCPFLSVLSVYVTAGGGSFTVMFELHCAVLPPDAVTFRVIVLFPVVEYAVVKEPHELPVAGLSPPVQEHVGLVPPTVPVIVTVCPLSTDTLAGAHEAEAGLFTLTVACPVPFPAEFVHVRVYVVSAPGLTTSEPPALFFGFDPQFPVQLSTAYPVTVQVSVVVSPDVIFAGTAVRLTVGGSVISCTATVVVAVVCPVALAQVRV